MIMGSLQKSFFSNPLLIQPQNHKPRTPISFFIVSCKYPPNDHHNQTDSSRKIEKQLAKLAIVTLAAGVLSVGSVGDAFAAKSGGRVGGQAFRSSAPRASSPRVNSRTNIYVNPPVAPPLIGGYGYGPGIPYYGGWGWSPFSFFAPGPGVAVGIGGGFDLLILFMIIGAVSAVVRRFLGPREEEDDY